MARETVTLIHNASVLVTMAGPDRARTGAEMDSIGEVANGAVAFASGKIIETGTSRKLLKKYSKAKKIDAAGRLVMPGFVDCHTHLVFAGSRAKELEMRVKGATYLQILEAGGGIHSTVSATRKASAAELERLALARLDLMAAHGTTTVETKSGYGLDAKCEKKILQVIQRLGKKHPLDIVPTYLGAHTLPKDVSREEYISWMAETGLPQFRKLAEFCDIFTEKGAYTIEETRRILSAAKVLGYGIKAHAGQFTDLGAAGFAASLGAASVDHLEQVSDSQLDMMRENGTVAGLLPGTPFFLLDEHYPDARRMISRGVAVALGTDFNPGSCPAFSMQMMIALAVLKMKMTTREALTAATINSACAINREKAAGSLAPGKKADIIILNVEDPAQIPCNFGANLVATTVKSGKIIFNS